MEIKAIKLTNKLEAATTDKVLVDAIQVAGGYMAITSDQRANLTSAQKVAGTLVYETDTGKTYRYIATAPDVYEWKEENQTVPEHNHEFKDIVDSAYDDSSKWEEITDLLNQHAYGDLIVVTQAVCPGNGGPGYRVCARCGRKRVELVTQQHVASSGWYVNNTSHTAWQKCSVCGGIMNMHSHLKDGQISYDCEFEGCPYSTEPM